MNDIDVSGPQRQHFITRFIQEEGFLLLNLIDQLNYIDCTLIVNNILPESVPTSHNRSISKTSKLDHYVSVQRYKATYSNFRDDLRTIEVHWAGRGLFQVSFLKPQQCAYLTRDMKQWILDRMDLNSDSRVASFLGELRVASGAMNLQLALRDNSLSALLWFQNEIRLVLVLLAFLINFILMMSLEKGYFTGEDGPQFSTSNFQLITGVLILLQCLLEIYSTLQTLILWTPLIVQEWQHGVDQNKAKHRVKLTSRRKAAVAIQHFRPAGYFFISAIIVSIIIQLDYIIWLCLSIFLVLFFRSLYFLLQEPFNMNSPWSGAYIITVQTLTTDRIATRTVFTLFSLFCLKLDQPYWCSVMLLQLVENSKTLRNVIRAITLPAYSLLQSALLGLICIFIFTVFGFYFFPNEFYNENQSVDECSNLLYCYATFLHNGLLNGGGIADHIKGDLGHEPIFSDNSHFTSRIVYDVVFFVFISVLLLNIIFGIIIDTFGNLREIQAEELRLRTSFCFICGLPKELFDARANAVVRAKSGRDAGSGGSDHSQREQLNFAGHIRREHHMWDYLFFLLYLKEKPSCNYTGLESYLAELVNRDDFSWVPVGVSSGVVDDSSGDSHKNDDSSQTLSARLEEMASKLQVNMTGAVKEEVKDLRTVIQQLSAEITALKTDVGDTLKMRNAGSTGGT